MKLFLPLRCAATVALVHVASRLFDTISLAKPVTSRASSGEVYLVGRGFGALSEAERGSVASPRRGRRRYDAGGARATSDRRADARLPRRRAPPLRARAAERLHERRRARGGAARYSGEKVDAEAYERAWGLAAGEPREAAAALRRRSGRALRIWEINARRPPRRGLGRSSGPRGAVLVQSERRAVVCSVPCTRSSEEPHADWSLAKAAVRDAIAAPGPVVVVENCARPRINQIVAA